MVKFVLRVVAAMMTMSIGIAVAAPSASAWSGRQAAAEAYATVKGVDRGVPHGLMVNSQSRPSFVDILPDGPLYKEIIWLASTGISTGYDDGTFRPLESVNRDAMAAFLYRLAGSPAFVPPTVSPFSDVAPSTQFYKEMAWVASAGISTGYSDGTYRPLVPVERNAVAAFLYRLVGSPAFTPPATSPFSDVTSTAAFYKEMTWVAARGVSTGYDDGTYRPWDPVKRDAMAAFMYRLAGIWYSYKFSGNASAVISLPNLGTRYWVAHVVRTGSSASIFSVVNRDGSGADIWPLVSTSGAYSGLLGLNTWGPGTSNEVRSLAVTASDSWEIDVTPVEAAPKLAPGASVAGSGDGVLYLGSFRESDTIRVDFGSGGSGYVFGIDAWGETVIQVSTGSPVVLPADVVALEIIGAGPWTAAR